MYKHFPLYFQTLCYQGGGYGTICIEDPFDAHNDVGKSSYGFPSVKTTFELTYFHLLKFVTPAVNAATNDLRYVKCKFPLMTRFLCPRKFVLSDFRVK